MSDLQLARLSGYREFPGPLVTVIIDGVGMGKGDAADGVSQAYTPVLDRLYGRELFLRLRAHGTAVGLPSDGDMGNSEVGHNALGSGRVYAQGAKLVNRAMETGEIFEGSAWLSVGDRFRNGGTVHFIGLLSDGNVHSHIDQLDALLDRCALEGAARVRVHVLLDGRDVGEKSALDYVVPLERKLEDLSQRCGDYQIASGGGRMITTMDRYNADWSVVERGWKAHVLGMARQFSSASEAVGTYYAEDPGITDQYMDSFVVARDGKPVGTIEDGDAVVFFNFRGDRAIEISRAFEEADFGEFDRMRRPEVFYAGIMQYDGDTLVPKNYLVEPPAIEQPLGELLCGSGVTSFAISETQKYGHITYFWNGNNSGTIDDKLETYVEIPSDKIMFDLRPWMKAAEITDRVLEAITLGRHKFIRLNYANGDMVGHTGIEAATRIAVATVDMQLGRLEQAIRKAGGILMVTADHGNADITWTRKNGKITPHVAHTLNPVPFVVQDFSGANRWKVAGVRRPGLSNVAGTICTLLGYEAPKEYDSSLLALG